MNSENQGPAVPKQDAIYVSKYDCTTIRIDSDQPEVDCGLPIFLDLKNVSRLVDALRDLESEMLESLKAQKLRRANSLKKQ